jgi:hypothetical protein
MNYRHVLRQLGLLMFVLGAGMAAIAGLEFLIWADLGKDEQLGLLAMGISAGIGMALGGGLWWVGRRQRGG